MAATFVLGVALGAAFLFLQEMSPTWIATSLTDESFEREECRFE